MKVLDGMIAMGGLALLVGGTVGCGGLSYRYDTGSIHPIPGSERLHAVATEALDARAGGEPLRATGVAGTDAARAAELTQVREAVHDHLARAGVIDAESPALPAPTTASEVDAAIASARARGATEVVFVRYHRAEFLSGCGSVGILAPYLGILPWLIIDSIPLWSHGAYGAFEVVVASAADGAVLARSSRVAAFSEHVSAWGCGGDGVMHDSMRRSLESALEDIVGEARAGWPSRSGELAVASLLAPSATIEGRRLVGVGWSIDAPDGWSLAPWDPSTPNRAARLTAGPGVNLDVTIVATSLDDEDFAHHTGDLFRNAPTLVEEHAVSVGDRDGWQIHLDAGGTPTFLRSTAAEGMGVVVACAGPAAICEAALQSFSIDETVLADGHRS